MTRQYWYNIPIAFSWRFLPNKTVYRFDNRMLSRLRPFARSKHWLVGLITETVSFFLLLVLCTMKLRPRYENRVDFVICPMAESVSFLDCRWSDFWGRSSRRWLSLLLTSRLLSLFGIAFRQSLFHPSDFSSTSWLVRSWAFCLLIVRSFVRSAQINDICQARICDSESARSHRCSWRHYVPARIDVVLGRLKMFSSNMVFLCLVRIDNILGGSTLF